MGVTCQVEPFAEFVEELKALVDGHWDEVGSFKEFQRVIDYPRYQGMDDEGKLLNVTLRDEAGQLVGYIIGAVGQDIHRATWDSPPQYLRITTGLVHYVKPTHRGYARTLYLGFERAALARGISIVSHRVKPQANKAGDFLAALGYGVEEIGYAKIIRPA